MIAALFWEAEFYAIGFRAALDMVWQAVNGIRFGHCFLNGTVLSDSFAGQ